MSDYGTLLLLQRGREAGGISLELVELYEEAISEAIERTAQAEQSFEEDLHLMLKFKADVHKLLKILSSNLSGEDEALVSNFLEEYPPPDETL